MKDGGAWHTNPLHLHGMITKTLTEANRDALIAEALGILLRGGIIAYPTETFYGLGVHFAMAVSLRRLYWLKMRPTEKSMPVVVGSREGLAGLASRAWLSSNDPGASALMNSFWPGPLTLLLPAETGLPEHLTGDSGKIAVRVPGDSFALRLAQAAGFPITATSANISGMPPAENAGDIRNYFGSSLDLLIDGGASPGGAPSTIVDVTVSPPLVLREGTIRRSEVEAVFKRISLPKED